MARQVTLGLIQVPCVDDVAANMEKTLHHIYKAANQGAHIICTQELFKSKYFCQTEEHSFFRLAEEVHEKSETVMMFSDVAKEKEVVLIASLFEKRAEGLYHNTAVVIDADGSYLGKYRKMHIPDDPHFEEKFYFAEGDLGYKVFDTKFAKIGVLICWDQWYPEAARVTALKGAEILFYPTAIGWLPPEKEAFGKAQHDAWQTIQRSHAIANGCYVASVNRVGFERVLGSENGIEFWGQSFVAAPSGEILQKASDSEEAIMIVPIDLEKINEQRTHWPFLRDRRIGSYEPLIKRFDDE